MVLLLLPSEVLFVVLLLPVVFMKRELFVCPTARGCGPARFANFSSTTAIFSSGCFARFALCSTTKPPGAEACASVWHAYVAPEAREAAENAADDARRRAKRARNRRRA